MMLRLLVFIGLLFATALPLRAAWHEASSDHFVIYANQKPEQVRAFAERLERYHGAMSYFLKANTQKPSPSNRVTIYVVRDEKEVRKLFGGDNRYVAGFYVPRAGGSLAIIPKVDSGESDWDLSGEEILYHEYAHHFMYGASSQSYPLWLSEGFAEFYAQTKFDKDGSVGLGLPATQRALEMAFSVNVPINRLLDTQAYLDNKSKAHDEFYGRSWSLFHYLFFADNRKGQLTKYLNLLRQRTPELQAAQEAFGDLKALDAELGRYVKQKKLSYLKISPTVLNFGTINVRPLDAGEAAIMPIIIQSKRGVDEKTAPALVPDARKIAAQFPQNAAVLAALAEVEFDAGNDAEAMAAANAALAINPSSINAHLQKSYAMARQAEAITDDKDAKKAWKAVREQLLNINAIENDHPLPLMHYYLSFARGGAKPTKNSIDGLEWALQLAPYDVGLRFTVAQQQLQDERFDDAILTLGPLANSPHQSEMAEAAQKMIEVAEAAKAGGEDEPADAG
jgi:Protein of unknown function (DUF1570)